ncbi:MULTISPECIES: hypothetical protein [Enterobacteriaceae]|uniref:hypothetical protein n=1 Tax=Enterobacteriaceae TaxID=543 RepID=UPI0009EC6314|nr:hypothetical protein [Salmonella enterica]EBQ5244718.1 hypothetical protein [Salmonella enterica subsp. salamae]EDM1754375.1 hypothetical protein [Salmonella enterica subsp. diarizonae]
MNTGIVLIFLAAYLHLGWCWVSILQHLSGVLLPQRRYWLNLIFWPASMIITDAAIDDIKGGE